MKGRALLTVWLAGVTASTAVTLGAARLINDQRLTDTPPEVADAAGRATIVAVTSTTVAPTTTAARARDVPGGPPDALAPTGAPPISTTTTITTVALPDPGTTVVASPAVADPTAPGAPAPSQPASSAPRGTTAPSPPARPRPTPPPPTTAKPGPKPTAPPPATTRPVRPAGCNEQSRSTAAGTVVVRFCGQQVVLVSAVAARDHQVAVSRQVGRITVVFRHSSGTRVQVVASAARGWSVRTIDGGNAATPTPPPQS